MSRLGYRITARFARTYFGRVFNHPHVIFTDAMLRPETQDLDSFADGMENIVTTQRTVAQRYFNDGSINSACPPLKALLHIMAEGTWENRSLNDPELRRLFSRESLLESDWVQATTRFQANLRYSPMAEDISDICKHFSPGKPMSMKRSVSESTDAWNGLGSNWIALKARLMWSNSWVPLAAIHPRRKQVDKAISLSKMCPFNHG